MIYFIFLFIFCVNGAPMTRHDGCMLFVRHNQTCYRPWAKSGVFLCLDEKFGHRQTIFACPVEDPNFHPNSATTTTSTTTTTTIKTTILATTTKTISSTATTKTTQIANTITSTTKSTQIGHTLSTTTLKTIEISSSSTISLGFWIMAIFALFLLLLLLIIIFFIMPKKHTPPPPPRPPPPNVHTGAELVPLSEISQQLANSSMEFQRVGRMLAEQLEARARAQEHSVSSDFSENTIVGGVPQGPFVQIPLEDADSSIYFDSQSRI